MKRRFSFPIRMKILVALLFVVTAAVSVITFVMANMFHEDKRTYINDLASMYAVSTAEECRSLLVGYAERLSVYARIMGNQQIPQEQRGQLVENFFEDFPELVAVTLYEEGLEVAAAVDVKALQAAGLSRDDLRQHRDNPLPFERLLGGEVLVENSTVAESLPTLMLAVAGPRAEDSKTFVVGVVRLDAVLRLAATSQAFEVFVLDGRGVLLAHPRPELVVRRTTVELDAAARALREDQSAGLTLEFEEDGRPMIGGFAAAGLGGVVAVAQIPRSAAYLASRDLLRRLMVVTLALLLFVALVSLSWSHLITRPVERLSNATRQIARGEFDVEIRVSSHDEIGTLARSFNQMASELHGREAALTEAHRQLLQSEKMAAFGQLGAGIAHEVKNPLTGILGCAQLSLRKAEEGSVLRKNLELIEKETHRCKTIIENLLKFARQEKAVMRPVEVNAIVEDACAIVHHQLEIKETKLVQELAADLPLIRGNANQLQQVLMNLLMNAQHATEGRAGSVTVTTRRADEDQVEIAVSDTGPGITEDVLERIFDPFFTTKPTGKGTGLGLSVSFGIVKDHRGEIRAGNRPGGGATFTITLPAQRDADVEEPPMAQTGS